MLSFRTDRNRLINNKRRIYHTNVTYASFHDSKQSQQQNLSTEPNDLLDLWLLLTPTTTSRKRFAAIAKIALNAKLYSAWPINDSNETERSTAGKQGTNTIRVHTSRTNSKLYCTIRRIRFFLYQEISVQNMYNEMASCKRFITCLTEQRIS